MQHDGQPLSSGSFEHTQCAKRLHAFGTAQCTEDVNCSALVLSAACFMNLMLSSSSKLYQMHHALCVVVRHH